LSDRSSSTPDVFILCKTSPYYPPAGPHIHGRLSQGPHDYFTLTKEVWDFDRQYAIFSILKAIFVSVQRYSETVLDASLLAQCILVLQDRTTLEKISFAKLLLLKLRRYFCWMNPLHRWLLRKSTNFLRD